MNKFVKIAKRTNAYGQAEYNIYMVELGREQGLLLNDWIGSWDRICQLADHHEAYFACEKADKAA